MSVLEFKLAKFQVLIDTQAGGCHVKWHIFNMRYVWYDRSGLRQNIHATSGSAAILHSFDDLTAHQSSTGATPLQLCPSKNNEQLFYFQLLKMSLLWFWLTDCPPFPNSMAVLWRMVSERIPRGFSSGTTWMFLRRKCHSGEVLSVCSAGSVEWAPGHWKAVVLGQGLIDHS